jgi:uncharacterized protein YjdB
MNKLQSLSFVLILLFLSLCSPTTCAAQSSPSPRIFFTDLDSAPNSGGESVNGFAGAYVTLYGNFFGASQGSSTVTWNGENCLRVVGPSGSYSGWGASHFWYQKIIVQLGSACTAGSGNFVVTVNGAASNGIPFTVRSTGKLLFVSTQGNDGNSGSFASPFATIPQCKSAMKAGDVCYIEDGVTATTVDNFDATLELESGGTAGNPVAFVAYPGAKATLGASGITYGLRVPNISVSANYVTVAGLFFSPSEQGMNPTNSSNWRVVGNNFQCPTANGEDGCFTTNEISSIKFLGNEATNIGVVAAGKQQHAVYFSSDTNHLESAWNYIHDNRSCRAMQFHSSPLGGGGAGDPTGHNQFDLSVHDNLIHDDPCDGINFATVDPSQGRVEAYNNVIYHVGIGPTPQDGDSGDYSCIYMAYITNTGPVGGGAVEIYNNTLYDCGSFVASFPNNGSFMINGGEPGLQVRIRNNIMYQLGNEPFGSGSGWNSAYVSGSNNIMHSTVTPPQISFLTGNITSDPLFLNLSSNNFHLQSASPAKDAGTTISSGNTYNNYVVWNGNPADREGVVRPQGANYDIGAYEFYAGSAPPPPSPPILQSIAVTPSPGSIMVGSAIAFTATAHYSDGSTQNVTTQAAWASSSSSVATIGSNTGVATGMAAGGPVTITASLSSIKGAASLTVTAPPPSLTLQSITVTPSPVSIAVGSTVAFTATGHYSDGSNKNLTTQAAWTSTSSSVAIVGSNTGVATGVAAGGPVTIIAALSGVNGTASLAVTAPPRSLTLQSITVTPSPVSIAVGSTVAFTATGHYSDGSNKNLTTQAAWSSTSSSVAIVGSNTGVATGMAAGGPVTINASVSGIKGAASLTVTSPSSVSVVNFDSPAPSGSPYSSINGAFGGINFGTGQWDWEPAYLNDPTNNIYFSSATGNKRTFSFARGSHVLIAMKVATSVAGTLTLSDGAGQTKTQNISTGAMQLVTTGWKNASSTITVTFTAGWNIEFDDITYQ